MIEYFHQLLPCKRNRSDKFRHYSRSPLYLFILTASCCPTVKLNACKVRHFIEYDRWRYWIDEQNCVFFYLGLKINLSVKIDVHFTVFWTGCREMILYDFIAMRYHKVTRIFSLNSAIYVRLPHWNTLLWPLALGCVSGRCLCISEVVAGSLVHTRHHNVLVGSGARAHCGHTLRTSPQAAHARQVNTSPTPPLHVYLLCMCVQQNNYETHTPNRRN